MLMPIRELGNAPVIGVSAAPDVSIADAALVPLASATTPGGTAPVVLAKAGKVEDPGVPATLGS